MDVLSRISEKLYMDSEGVLAFAQSSPYRYKVYSIAKRNSTERRTIAHPSKELKFVQRIVIEELENVLPTHHSSKAYKKGLSVKDNALPHVSSNYLLKMDLKNFFPTITSDLFFKECRINGIEISEVDKQLLKGILFWKRRRSTKLVLSIGAPSSPLVSNFMLNRFDEEVFKLCNDRGIKYTRYADDLTFSTSKKGVLLKFPVEVRRLLNVLYDGNIKVNLNKTVLTSKAHNRHVTGITLSNDSKLTVGRNYKRLLSAKIHYFTKGMLGETEKLELQGYLSYVSYIEPEFIDRMINKYGAEAINAIQHAKRD